MNTCQVTLLIALIIFLLLIFVDININTNISTKTNSRESFLGTTQSPFWNSNVKLLGKQLPHELSKLRYSP